MLDALQRNMVSGRSPPPAALLLGLSQLVAAAPPVLVRPHFQTLLPWLLEALRSLQQPSLGHPLLLRALLLLIAAQSADSSGTALGP